MKTKKQGDDTRVDVSRQEVIDFKAQWPCSGLPDKPITFIFDSRGDLVDVFPKVEGDGVPALLQDAKQFAGLV